MRQRHTKTTTEIIIELEASLPLEELPALQNMAAEFNGRTLAYNANPEDYSGWDNFDNYKYWQRYRKFMILRKEQLEGRKAHLSGGAQEKAFWMLHKHGCVESHLHSNYFGVPVERYAGDPEQFYGQLEPATERTIPWATFKALVRKHVINLDGTPTDYGKELIAINPVNPLEAANA